MQKLFVAVLLAAILITLPTVAFAQEDVTPPMLLDVAFDPAEIDTSRGPVTVTVTIHISDDLSGVKHASMHFRKPDTTQHAQVEFRPAAMPNAYFGEWLSGDELDGWYINTMTIPQYAAYGEWEMYYVGLEDNVGNRSSTRKPEDEGESLADGDDSEWPSLWNAYAFSVGQSGVPEQQEFARQLFLPVLQGREDERL